jgi:RNA polymerase sigma factor FliA
MPPCEEDDLVRRSLPLLHTVAYRMWQRLGGNVELDELVSLGLAVLLQAIRRFDPERAELSPYLARRLKWSMLAEARKRARRLIDPGGGDGGVFAETRGAARGGDDHVPLLDRSVRPGPPGALTPGGDLAGAAICREEDPEIMALRREAARVVQCAMKALPDRQRRLLERHYFDGTQFESVATEIGISRAAASRLHRTAVEALGRELRRIGFEGVPKPPPPKRRVRRAHGR